MTPDTGLDITTNTNEAYNLVTRVEGGGGVFQGIQHRSQQVGESHKDSHEVPAPPPMQSSQGQRGTRTAAGAASEGRGEGGGEGGGDRGGSGGEGREGGTREEAVVYELIPGEK